MNTIYCFNNGGYPGWYEAIAIGQDGHIVGQHICSHEAFMAAGNWELEWVSQPRSHAGLAEAFRLHTALGEGIPDGIKASATITFQ